MTRETEESEAWVTPLSDLVAGLLPGCSVTLVPWAASGFAAEAIPSDGTTSEAALTALAQLAGGDSEALFDGGFALRAGTSEDPLAALVAWNLPSDSARQDALTRSRGMVPLIARAVAGDRDRAALAEREQGYRLLAESFSDVVYVAGADRRVSWVAPSVTGVLGWDPDELIGTIMADLVHPDDRAATTAHRDAVYALAPTGETLLRDNPPPSGVPGRVRTRDGGYRWMLGTGRPLFDESGRITGLVVSLRDVDDLFQARDEAEAERQRLRATLDSLLDPHVYLRAVRDEGGAIVDFVYEEANEAACDYNHRSYDDLIGASLLEVLPGHEASGILAEYARVVDSGEALVVDGLRYYNEILGLDRWSDVRGIRVGDGLSMTWRDVTERYEAAAALQESERRYRYLAEHSSDVVYLAGPDRRVLWVAPSITTSLGWPVEDVVGRTVTDFLHPDDAAGIAPARDLAYSGSAASADGTELGTVRVLTRDGAYRWFSVSITPVPDDDGSFMGVVGSMHDVDALVHTRQAALRDRARLDATMDTLLDPHVFLQAIRDRAGAVVDFLFTDVNQAASRYLRMPEATLIGTTLLDLLPDVGSNEIFGWFVQTVDNGTPIKMDDVRYTNESLSTVHWYDIRGNRVEDGLSFLWRDVTSRHATAAALEESEERYRLLAENASDVVYLAGSDGRVRWVAPSITRTLGWLPADIIGTEVIELAHPDDQPAIQSRRSLVYSGGVDPPREESEGLLLRVRTKSGPYLWTVASNTILRDDTGALVGVAGSMRDVDDLVRAREEAQRERLRLQTTLNSLQDPHVFFDPVLAGSGSIVDFSFADVNLAACAYLDMTPERLVGSSLLQLMPDVLGSGLLEKCVDAFLSGHRLELDDFPFRNEAFAEVRRFDIRAITVGDGLSVTWRDVTERFSASKALADSEARYRLLADNSSDVVVHLRDGVLEWVSTSIVVGLGWRPDEVEGRKSLEFIHPDDHHRVMSGRLLLDAGRSARRRYRFRAKDGGYHWVDAQGGPLLREDGTPDGSVISLRIVDAEVRAQEALEQRARLDHLTGLANREEAFERLGRILRRARSGGDEIAIVFCDFDDFKRVNDTHGHAGGDELLRVVAARIRASVRAADLVARIGGDELLVVLDGVHDLDEASRLAENLRKIVVLPVELPDGMVSITLSVGVTLAGDGESLDDVIARADVAMYRAKKSGRDQVIAIPAA